MLDDKIQIIKEENTPPLKSQNTWLVAGMLTSGIPLQDKGYNDMVEVLPSGETKRITSWIPSNKTAKFTPIKEEEEIDASEFARRFLSKEWCEANADHPIAYLRFYMETYQNLRNAIRERKPSALIRRGGRFAVISPDATEKEREKMLSLI
jgi:hypothetical protein